MSEMGVGTQYYDNVYEDWLRVVHDTMVRCAGNAPVFTTDATGLFDAYLSGLPGGEVRQRYNCHACKDFIERFGGLVVIDDNGVRRPAVWDYTNAPAPFRRSVLNMVKLVIFAKITGRFFSDKRAVGTASNVGKNGVVWNHFTSKIPASALNESKVHTAEQVMARYREDHRAVVDVLGELDSKVIRTVVRLLEADVVYQADKFAGFARWLRDLSTIHKWNGNLVWKHVATAPTGFCHVRSSVVWSLIEDIRRGRDVNDALVAFREKVAPGTYQRPRAAPTEGNIDRATRLIERLGLTRSLERRYARFDEIPRNTMMWVRRAVVEPNGVFDHLRPNKNESPGVVNAGPITWVRFAQNVMPTAKRIVFSPNNGLNPFFALVTAVHPDAPNVLRWNNTFNWYVYVCGSLSRDCMIDGPVDVLAVTNTPDKWDLPVMGDGVLLFLNGVVDSKKGLGLALFPQVVRDDLHEVRATIEAHSNSRKLEDWESSSANGLLLAKGCKWPSLSFTVSTDEGVDLCYEIDRWE